MRLFLLVLVFVVMFSQYIFAGPLDEAYKSYLNEDYEEAIIKAKNAGQTDETLYFLGLVFMKMGNFPQSREYFLKVTQDFPRSVRYEEASIKLADSYFLEGNFSKAKGLYKEVEKKYPSSDYRPLIYLKLARVAAKTGQWDERKKYINLLKEKYPASNELAVWDTIPAKEDFFTIQVGAFSSRKNALSLRNELSAKYDTYLVEEKKENYILHKVRLGKFKTRKEAEKIWGRLVKQGYPAHIYP
ncbi:MAG: tetratricopeptide repeat protein [Candidatus Omnitrophota bacterium]|jgi:tetratricopeptide (TPR) repeat protein